MKFSLLFIVLACIFNIGLISAKKKGKGKTDCNCKECGQAFDEHKDTFIVNGKKVIPTNKYPWVVALMTMPKRRIHCGGAIINRYYILTAAHCVQQFAEMATDRKKLTSQTGTKGLLPSFLSFKELQVGFVTDTDRLSKGREIEEIIYHPGYKLSGYFINDIALLKLKKPIKCNNFTRPICLPGKDINTENKDVLGIAGWGAGNAKKDDASNALNEARMVLNAPETCKDIENYSKHSNKSLCLEGAGEQSPCFGDSGGTMFKQYEGRYYTIGVASTSYSPKGKYCDNKENLVIYTSVQKYTEWIKKVTGITPKKQKPPKNM